MLPLSNSRRKTLFRAGLFCDLKVLLKKLIFFCFKLILLMILERYKCHKKIKNIILMYFQTKNILKRKRYHNTK